MGLNFAEITDTEAYSDAAEKARVIQKQDADADKAELSIEALPPAGITLSLESIKPRFRDAEDMIAGRMEMSKALAVTDDESLKMAVAIVGEAKKAIRSIDDHKKNLPEYKEAKGFVDKVNNFVGDLKDRLTVIVDNLDPRVVQYNARVELERRQREEAQKRAAEELQKKLDAEVAEANRKAQAEAARIAEEELRARLAKEAEERAKKHKEDEAARIEREKREAVEIEAARKKAEEEAKQNDIVAPQVQAPIAPKQDSTVRTETGTTAFSKKPWKHEIVDTKLVPREYCVVSDVLIRNAIKAGVRDIPGVKIYQDTKMNYR